MAHKQNSKTSTVTLLVFVFKFIREEELSSNLLAKRIIKAQYRNKQAVIKLTVICFNLVYGKTVKIPKKLTVLQIYSNPLK